ncbi:MAG: AbrB/MazE/SpoVT family DNA-binding domain-containing protein [Oscillospiraceae bacterium]
MKSIGIVRKIDDLGRIVLPIELRRVLTIDEGSSLEIFVEDDKIILKKYQTACLFCGEANNTIEFKGRTICSDCLASLRK